MNIYTAIQGDTWDLVAKKTMGSEYAMSALINANIDKMNVRIFKGGESLLIPEINIEAVTITPPWNNE